MCAKPAAHSSRTGMIEPMHIPHFDTGSAPLAGATLIITRTVGMSAAFAARARALGGNPVVVPGLTLRAATDATAARAALHAAHDAQVWIFTSPAAVRFAFQLAPDLTIDASSLAVCVGPGTARALGRYGVQALVPQTSSDSEGLLALPDLAEMRGRRVALLCAPNGRDLITAQLRQRGAQVDAIHVYQRAVPRLTRRHFEAIENSPGPLILLLSSAAALNYLSALIPAPVWQRLQRQTLVASSARLAALADAGGFENIVEADSAMPDDLLKAAARALARHRL